MKLHSLYEFELKPREQFNFHLTASCYNFNWWFNGTKCIIPSLSSPSLVAIIHYRDGYLVAEVYGAKRANVEDVANYVEYALGLHEDLKEFYEVAKHDPILCEVPTSLQGMRMRATDLWNALLIAICQQNASFLQGWRMLCRIYKVMGTRVELNGITTIIPPSPEDLVAEGARDLLKKAGVGYRAETLIRVAMAIKRDFLDQLKDLKDDEAESMLKEIKGVGSYSARLALILSQRRYGLLPLDRWLKRLAEEVYGLRDVEEGLKAKWGRWCGLATFFTTVVLDAEVLRKALKRALNGDVKPRLSHKSLSPLTLWMHSIC